MSVKIQSRALDDQAKVADELPLRAPFDDALAPPKPLIGVNPNVQACGVVRPWPFRLLAGAAGR